MLGQDRVQGQQRSEVKRRSKFNDILMMFRAEQTMTMIETWRCEALQILQKEKDFKRDDYLEFLELLCVSYS